jgi:hypothetical protein
MSDESGGCFGVERNGFGGKDIAWEEREETFHEARRGGAVLCVVNGIEDVVGVEEVAFGDCKSNGL